MSDVFVSYKAEDRARVRPLVEALEADGLSVWWDAHVGGGEEWRDAIARHLDEARCVIVVWSKRSVGPEGHFVRDEATRALRRHAYLPVRIDKVDPPLGFGETQALPLNGWKGNRSDPRYAAVANAVRSIIGLEPHPETRDSTTISRRPLLIGGGATMAALAAGGWWFLKPDAARSNSIAVLPFANLSGDPSQAYFSDGLAEELRSALSRIAGLRVVARTSSEIVRENDAKTAARKLGVEHIVAGSVRRSPDMIRVNAQLIDGDDGLERWSETFDRPAGDLLEVQTSIAQNVAQALSLELGTAQGNDLALGGTGNAVALDLYLQSDPTRQADTEEALRKSLGLIESAVALDPNFAQAHARKAFLLVLLAGVYALSSAEAQSDYERAMASVERAIEIEPRLAEAYATRAVIYRDQQDFGRALADLETADSLPGNDAQTLRLYAMMLSQSRMFEEAQQKIALAKALDPLNPVSLEIEALLFFHAGRYAEAEEVARRAIRLAPDRIKIRSILAASLLMQGRTAEAAAEYAKLDPNDYRRLVGEATLAAKAGNRGEALEKMQVMRGRYGDATLYQDGQIYAQLGMTDEAIAALQRALEVRDSGLAGLQIDPFLDPVRSDPRFAAIKARLNFPRS